MSFFDKLSALCKERGTSPSAVAREIGLNNSSATYWKRGAIPKGDTLKKLANYFGVSVDYLVRADITDISLDLSENIAKMAALIKSIYGAEETPPNIKRIIERQDINIDDVISQLTEVVFKAYHHTEAEFDTGIDLSLVAGRLQKKFGFPAELADKITEEFAHFMQNNARSDIEVIYWQLLNRLTDEGKKKGRDYLEDLSGNPRYKRKHPADTKDQSHPMDE